MLLHILIAGIILTDGRNCGGFIGGQYTATQRFVSRDQYFDNFIRAQNIVCHTCDYTRGKALIFYTKYTFGGRKSECAGITEFSSQFLSIHIAETAYQL